jgi:hypothetical protein
VLDISFTQAKGFTVLPSGMLVATPKVERAGHCATKSELAQLATKVEELDTRTIGQMRIGQMRSS